MTANPKGMKASRLWLVGLAVVLVVGAVSPAGAASTGSTRMVSVSYSGTAANAGGTCPCAMSPDGRWVAFHSSSTDVVPGLDPTKAVLGQTYVRDMHSGVTVLASSFPDGSISEERSIYPDISADGRFVVFETTERLLTSDRNSGDDTYRKDLWTGAVVHVSVPAPDGGTATSGETPRISDDGRYVVFQSSASLVSGLRAGPNIFVRDVVAGTTSLVSKSSSGVPGNGGSTWPFISGDGRVVAFSSYANDLVAGDTNGQQDAFVHDLSSGVTERISIASDGTQADQQSTARELSRDASVVSFTSRATSLHPQANNPVREHIYVRDRSAGETELVSVTSSGQVADFSSGGPSVSESGRYVVFDSAASNLDPYDFNQADDVFVRDRALGLTSRASVTYESEAPRFGFSAGPVISGDARSVVFTSISQDMSPEDSGGDGHVYMRDWLTAPTRPMEVSASARLGVTGSVTVRWKVPVSDQGAPVVAYRLYRADEYAGPYALVAEVPATTYQDSGLGLLDWYFYKVRAVNAYGEGEDSEVACAMAWPGAPLSYRPLCPGV